MSDVYLHLHPCKEIKKWSAAPPESKYTEKEKDRRKVERLKSSGTGHLFRPGSTYDLLMDSLDSGDVVLFNRDPIYLTPWDALLSVLRKRISGCRFDHVGVVLAENPGAPPTVAFADEGGRLRQTPFDECVMTSRCEQIAVRRINRSEEKFHRDGCIDRRRRVAERVADVLEPKDGGGGRGGTQPRVLGSSAWGGLSLTANRRGASYAAAFVASTLGEMGVVVDRASSGQTAKGARAADFFEAASGRALESPIYARL
eukprot:g4960.t1